MSSNLFGCAGTFLLVVSGITGLIFEAVWNITAYALHINFNIDFTLAVAIVLIIAGAYCFTTNRKLLYVLNMKNDYSKIRFIMFCTQEDIEKSLKEMEKE